MTTARRPYAQNTSVSAGRSREEIETLLERYGADGFAYAYDRERAMVQFRMRGRLVRFWLDLPPNPEQFRNTARNRQRTDEATLREWEQAKRRRWRSLALAVKARLDSIEIGIETFESAFLAHLVLPNDLTIGELLAPQLAAAYETGVMPALLPARR
ncbi:MAG: hypothetical protein NTZ05_16675 [Chloroflexi bacterium]|nr:hypothetical protein [Chloroflexota bacterium]